MSISMSFAHSPNIPFLSFVSKQDLRTQIPLVSKAWKQHGEEEFESRFLDLYHLAHRSLACHQLSLNRSQFQTYAITFSELKEKIQTFYRDARLPGTNVLICFYPNGTEYLRIVMSSEDRPMIHDIPQGTLFFSTNPANYGLENINRYVLSELPFQENQANPVIKKPLYYLMQSEKREIGYRVQRLWKRYGVVTTIQGRYPYEVSESDQETLQKMITEYSKCIEILKTYFLNILKAKVFYVLHEGDQLFLENFLKILFSHFIIPSEINVLEMDKYLLNQSMTDVLYKPALYDMLVNTSIRPFLINRSVQKSLDLVFKLMKTLLKNPDNFSWACRRFERELRCCKDLSANRCMATLRNAFDHRLNRVIAGVGPCEDQVVFIAKLQETINDSLLPPLLAELLHICIQAEDQRAEKGGWKRHLNTD